jgi:ferrochelatase
MLEVAEHYYHFGGVSPINAQTRALIEVLGKELKDHGISLPIYWGNRNWHPLLPETMGDIVRAGHNRVLALVLSAYSSYSSCRQYQEDIQRARETVGEAAPPIDKIRVFFNHPEFIAANADRISMAIQGFTSSQLEEVFVVYTAHSLPLSMAGQCAYESQLLETCRLVSEALGIPAERSRLVYQSRSGRPQDPWLGPDICDFLRELKHQGRDAVLVAPIGFLSDHMEVLFDLDEEAKQLSRELGMKMIRAETVGTHPRFVAMLRELIEERLSDVPERKAVGRFPASHDLCPLDCCPAPPRPSRA